jgi:hypothetical protein
MTDEETSPPPTSAAARQRTCAGCGAPFAPDTRTEVEVLLDGEVRYVAVHPGHSTYPPARERAAAQRLGHVSDVTDEGREAA